MTKLKIGMHLIGKVSALIVAAAVLGANATACLAQGAAVGPPSAPPPILSFDEAVSRAATNLLSNADLTGRTGPIPLVINPLVDGVSGVQSDTTRNMEERLKAIVARDFPRFELLPFNSESIAKDPIVMMGTFTAVNNAGQPQGERDAYRVWFTLADTKSKTIVGKAMTRAAPQGIRHIPTAFFDEAPAMGKDAAIEAYVRTCQGSTLAAPLDEGYLANLRTDAYIAEAIAAYDTGAYRKSLELYQKARAERGGTQLRVYNGLYLANWRLADRKAASEAFAQLVDYGLTNGELAVRFLFRPGTSSFINDRDIRAQYPMWFARIATAVQARNVCLEAIGHASRSGPEPLNIRLSKERAARVRAGLLGYAKPLANRIRTSGVGSSEALIGTGRDDASDAIDRRVAFKLVNC